MARLYTYGDLKRSLLIAALVGTVLVLINQGPDAGAAGRDPLLLVRMALNYGVPFTVATVSAVLANRAHHRREAERGHADARSPGK